MRSGGLIAAVVFAAIAAIIVLRMMGDSAPPPQPSAAPVAAAPEVKAVNIYVAAVPISIGTKITQDMLAIQPWPENLMVAGFVGADDGSQAVVGMVARSTFQQQEPIIGTKLANPSDPNFLAGELPKGMRVITIQTNETEGLAGFVFPGDFVDVMLTHDVEKNVPQGVGPDGVTRPPLVIKETVTETVLTNVKVIAVDQRANGAGTTDERGNLIIPRTVSMMVSPTDAQRLRLGQNIGTLTLVLRSLADRESVDPLSVTSSSEMSQYQSPQAAAEAEAITVYRGVERESVISQKPDGGHEAGAGGAGGAGVNIVNPSGVSRAGAAVGKAAAAGVLF